MENIYDRFEHLSCDAGPIRERKLPIFLDPGMIEILIPQIEQCFEEYEKVSFSFLFFDDVSSCLNICEKCLKNYKYNFISDNLINKHLNWDEKFVECVFYMQHILVLLKLGIGIYDAKRVFERSKFVSKQRVILYKICENLTNAESLQVMESVSSITQVKYLEIFILKILSSYDDGLQFLISKLFALNNSVINSFLEELNESSCIINGITATQKSNPLPKSVNSSKDEMYPIKDPENVGLCVIINEVNFKGQEKRDGSSEDVAVLISTMKYFNIAVKPFTDVTKKHFELLSKMIDMYFREKNYSVFFMVIMSHGIPGAILSSDDKSIDINFITDQLMYCKALNKIPKVLIIQACQGHHFLRGDVVTDGPTSLEADQIPEKISSKCKSHISDFLLAMATVKGFKAFREISSDSTVNSKRGW
ncbi:caspase-8 isoform X2 [Halyomorpha halys]|uniref:caspase-8 isoform X2 n=1 Tax=Halyomorpha halys TaxID=286706 RepID=UPI0034D30E2F